MSGDARDFKDHFSALADNYRWYRPRYPEALFAYLAGQAPGSELAWDCGCGSGQAAVGLARHFGRVIASDASAEQIARAETHPRIAYRVAPAEASGLGGRSADLVTVAQALHWFNLPRFYAEARRVLKKNGLLAVFGYGWLQVSPNIDPVLANFYGRTLGPWWPPERRLLDEGYRDLPFPFVELEPPSFFLEARWTLPQLLGYFETWSALKRYRAATGSDPLPELAGELAKDWGDLTETRRVTWPLVLRLGRNPES